MTAFVGLACNKCGTRLWEWALGQVSTTRIRAKAKEEGWHKRYRDGVAIDICFSCWEEGER